MARTSVKIGMRVRGVMPDYSKKKPLEPFPEELVGVEGEVVPDGYMGRHARDEQRVQVMFDGYDHPVACCRWELEAVTS